MTSASEVVRNFFARRIAQGMSKFIEHQGTYRVNAMICMLCPLKRLNQMLPKTRLRQYMQTLNGDVEIYGRPNGGHTRLCGSVLELLLLQLFTENATAHLKNGFEAFPATLSILTESLDTRFLNLILDLLPTAAKSSNLCLLLELCRRRRL